mgnify:CR=1 FL=1
MCKEQSQVIVSPEFDNILVTFLGEDGGERFIHTKLLVEEMVNRAEAGDQDDQKWELVKSIPIDSGQWRCYAASDVEGLTDDQKRELIA